MKQTMTQICFIYEVIGILEVQLAAAQTQGCLHKSDQVPLPRICPLRNDSLQAQVRTCCDIQVHGCSCRDFVFGFEVLKKEICK